MAAGIYEDFINLFDKKPQADKDKIIEGCKVIDDDFTDLLLIDREIEAAKTAKNSIGLVELRKIGVQLHEDPELSKFY